MGRLSLGLGFAAGYVLGTRAGRARFEQIKRTAVSLSERPEVQQALDKVRDAAPAPLQGIVGGRSQRASGGTGDMPGGSTGGTTPGAVGLPPDVGAESVVTPPTGSSAPAEPLTPADLPRDEPDGRV